MGVRFECTRCGDSDRVSAYTFSELLPSIHEPFEEGWKFVDMGLYCPRCAPFIQEEPTQ